MNHKIEIGQIWFNKNKNIKEEYRIVEISKSGRFYQSFDSKGKYFTPVDQNSFDVGSIHLNGWHYRWADDIFCDCNIFRKDCEKHA